MSKITNVGTFSELNKKYIYLGNFLLTIWGSGHFIEKSEELRAIHK